MHKFTVIGYYEETGQTFAYLVRAADPHAAIQIAVNGDYIDMCNSSDVVIVGAVKGDVDLTAPCDESGAIAYACDLIQEEAAS